MRAIKSETTTNQLEQHVREIPVGGIHIPTNRLRAVRQETVNELAQSMQERGLLQPIVVVPVKGSGHRLIAGEHRLRAAKKLKWKTIQCKVIPGLDEDQEQLAEIDENLMRGELDAAERAHCIHVRKTLYERLHPETQSVRVRGGPGRGHKTKNQGQNGPSFVADTAKKANRSVRSVKRDATRGKVADPWIKHNFQYAIGQGWVRD